MAKVTKRVTKVANEDKLASYRDPDGSINESAIAALVDELEEGRNQIAVAEGQRDTEARWHDAFREFMRVHHYPHIERDEFHTHHQHRRYTPNNPFDLDAHHEEVIGAKAFNEVSQEYIDEEIEAEKARIRAEEAGETVIRASEYGAGPDRTPEENARALTTAYQAAKEGIILVPHGVYARADQS